MKTQSDDWDAEERETLNNLQPELDALRARHAGDPPLDLLRAADSDALPEELQARVSRHLSESDWSRALVQGADDVDVSLSSQDERRLLRRIQKEASQTSKRSLWDRLWIPALATAAVAVVAIVVIRQADWTTKSTEQPTAPPSASVPAPTSPQFQLALAKPDVKLSPAALTYRGTTGEQGFLGDIKPALDAFRQNDYARADREFSALAPRYPQSVEVAFYQGVARLFQNDIAGADVSLVAAEGINEASFASEVAWYRAVVDERSGRPAAARTRLDGLCRDATFIRRAQACEAANRLK